MPDTKKQRIHDSEAARAAAKGATSAASAEAIAGSAAALLQAEHDAFWAKFAENVMNHIVWPAVWRGVIRTASKVHTDHPEWWYQGIVPILQHPDVFSLYYKGGKRMASRTWGYVCAQLACQNVAEQDAAGRATQVVCA